MTYDALIVGGGPGGAATALLLAQAGWSVAVVEKRDFPRRKVCGEFISATNLPLLHQLGIAEFYLNQGGPEVRRVGLFAANSVLASSMPQAKHSLGHWGRALGREHLDTVLLELAVRAGATLWQPWQVKTIQGSAGKYNCTLASKLKTQELSARVLIMANGSWERGLDSCEKNTLKPSDLLAFKAHFKNSDLASDLMPMLAFPGGYGGLAHSDSGRMTLSCCIRRDTLLAARKKHPGLQAGEIVMQHISTSCLGVRQVLSGAERLGTWLSAGPIRPGIRKCYADGVFYVGNIAGEAHPVVAEGISMAMQSAWLLSQALIKHHNTEDAGQDYSKQWKAHFANRIHAAALFAQIAMRPWAPALLLPILKSFPRILTFGAKLSGKVNQVVPALISAE